MPNRRGSKNSTPQSVQRLPLPVLPLTGGTEGSNPASSSGESVSAVDSRAVGEKPRAFAPVCTGSGTREGDGLAVYPKTCTTSLDAGEHMPPHILAVDMRDAVSVTPGERGWIGAGKDQVRGIEKKAQAVAGRCHQA